MLNNYLRSPLELDFDANIRIISYSAKKIEKIAKKFSRAFAQGFGRIRNHSAKLIRSEPVIVRSCSSFVHRSFNSFNPFVWVDRSPELRLLVRVCMCMRVYVCVTPWAWIISPNNHNKPQSY